MFPVHCCHSSLPGRYASAAYTPVCGGTTDNMPRIPGGGSWNVAICCGPASSLFVGSVFRYGSHWFASGATCRPSRIVPRWHGMTRRECAAMRRYTSGRGARYGSLWFGSPGVGGASLRVPSPAGGGTGPDMARILPGVPVGEYRTVSVLCLAMSRYVAPPARAITGRETGRPGVTSCRQGGVIPTAPGSTRSSA